jgi:hypothetical protein
MDSNEIALLELLTIKPFSYFPPQPYMIARRLASRGLVAFKDGHWYATAEGARAANCPELYDKRGFRATDES